MRPIQQTQSGVGVGAWLPVDRHPFSSVSYGCRVTGTVTYNVEYTYENVLAGATPTQVFAAQTGKTANQDGVINQPIAAIRLNVTAATGGSVTMDVLQGTKE